MFDDFGLLGQALYGHRYFHTESRPVLGEIRLTSMLLDQTWTASAEEVSLIRERGNLWAPLVAGLGGVALRAISPATSESDRLCLLALLDVWAETVFADPTRRVRVGWARYLEDMSPVVIGSGGVATAVVDRREHGLFVDLRTGEVDPPALGDITWVCSDVRPWGSAEQLVEFTRLVRERGPVPWDHRAPEELKRSSGLSHAASALLLAGYAQHSALTVRRLDPHRRQLLALTPSAVPAGMDELSGVSTRMHHIPLLAEVIPPDPAQLWAPDGMCAVAARTAEAWVAKHGRKPVVSESTIAAAVAVKNTFGTRESIYPTANQLCAALADDDLEAKLNDSGSPGNPFSLWSSGEERPLWQHSWGQLIEASRWAYAYLPVGDPVRDGVPRTFELIRAQLRNSRLTADQLPYSQWIAGEDCDRMIDRITHSGLAAGCYEFNPALTAPDLVVEVAAQRQLSTDAAALYLQLLTVPRPTDNLIRTWNGWKSKQHKPLEDELIKNGVAMRDKVSGAARTLFLPGGCDRKLAVEHWKTCTLATWGYTENRGLSAPRHTATDLFHAAWQRVLDGEYPH